MLYVCFDLLRPDVIAELSWQHGLNDFYMPYQIQVQRATADKVCIFYTFNDMYSRSSIASSIGDSDEGPYV
jgi:hypothetical protein